MNLLILCLLAGLGLSYASNVKFYRICDDGDTFEYNGLTVNSVYRISKENILPKIGDFAVDEFLDFSNYFDNRRAELLESNKKIYNTRLIELYSEELLNSPQFTKDNYRTANGLLEVLNAMKTFRVAGDFSEGQKKLNESIAQVEKGWRLALELMTYKGNYLNLDIMNLHEFESVLSEVRLESFDKMIFENDMISNIYRRAIFQFDKFELNRHSRIFFDWRSKGTMSYSIYLPANHSPRVVGKRPACLKASQLPAFFRDPNAR